MFLPRFVGLLSAFCIISACSGSYLPENGNYPHRNGSYIPGNGSSISYNRSCRYLPGDSGWPSPRDWAKLNTTVHGRLISNVPLGSVCHDPTYNETACNFLFENWIWPQTHFPSPGSIMDPYFQSNSCNPFEPRSSPCLLGNEVVFTINVTNAEDIAAGVKFAWDHNIRLVIKNTGHDYLGKSTGKGSLGLWTHNLKSIDFFNYTSSYYNGPVIKMGAGVQAFEAYTAADAHGYRVVGGVCLTVGLAGGYSQGGGHGPMGGAHGLGADQVVEWEVVTADGRHLIASQTQNSDLYWALSGGGGGTYAVVLSMTSKVYPDGSPVGGAELILLRENLPNNTYWDLITEFNKNLKTITDQGGMVEYVLNSSFIAIESLTLPNGTEDEVRGLLKPWTSKLDAVNATYQLSVTSFTRYYEHVATYIGPFPYGSIPDASITGGHLISQEAMAANASALTQAYRGALVEPSSIIGGFALNASRVAHPDNAVFPSWRTAAVSLDLTIQWDFSVPFSVMRDRENFMTNSIVPSFEAVSPGAGVYLNEADFQQPDWQEAFYGANYPRLLRIKKKYDPNSLFYATTAVGSEAWSVARDGRLCRA